VQQIKLKVFNEKSQNALKLTMHDKTLKQIRNEKITACKYPKTT